MNNCNCEGGIIIDETLLGGLNPVTTTADPLTGIPFLGELGGTQTIGNDAYYFGCCIPFATNYDPNCVADPNCQCNQNLCNF